MRPQHEDDEHDEVADPHPLRHQEAHVVAELEQVLRRQVVGVVGNIGQQEVDVDEQRHALEQRHQPRLVAVQQPAHEVVDAAEQAGQPASATGPVVRGGHEP